MRKEKIKRLESKGWKVGSAEDFLNLSPEETACIDLKLNLSANLRKLRAELNLTQIELAKRIHSSQSRVAKIESDDPTFSRQTVLRPFDRPSL